MSTPALRTSWRLLPPVAVSVAAAALVLSGCAEPVPVVSGGGTVAPASGAPSRTSSGTTSTPPPTTSAPSPSTATGTSRPTSTATSTKATAAWPTRAVALGKTLTDTGLGHKIVVRRMLRALPWPEGYVATSQTYELVALEMTWTPSKTYTAPLRRQDFSLRTGAPFPSRPIDLIDPAMLAHRLPGLPGQLASGKTATAWLVFKVDPKGAKNLTLSYTRPKAQVSGSGQVFDTTVFSVVLTGARVPTG